MELRLSNINKSFGEKHVLKGISFSAMSGKAVGLLGRNGSGKTTTIRIVMDVFLPDSGEVTIDGISNRRSKVKIGYLPEERGLYPKKLISDQMIYFGELRGMSARDAKENSKAILKKLEAEEYFNKKLETLSKGNQQKIQLAIAVINNPDIVILDEPFSGLDPVNAILLKKLVGDLASEGKTILFSSHQMNYVEEFCDDIHIINRGVIVAGGSIKQLKKTYPRNKVLINAEDAKLPLIQSELESDDTLKGILSGIKRGPDGLIVTLKRDEDKKLLFLSRTLGKYDIDGIRVIEPTLEQIFVDKAGDTDETIS